MEYLALAVIIGIAGYVIFRNARKAWSGESPCSCCTQNCHKKDEAPQPGCDCSKEDSDRKPTRPKT